MTEHEEIFSAYRDKVASYLFSRVSVREDAEDLCSEVFAKVYRSLPEYDAERSSLSTWIYNITRYTLIDYMRTKRTFEPLGEELAAAADVEETFIKKETLSLLAKARASLDEQKRDIIILRYYKGHTLTEISRITGIGYGMVKIKHRQALDALRQSLI